MSPTLHVFTDHDRHKVLMDLARKVALQVNDNPDHRDYHDATDYEHVPVHQPSIGK